MTKPVSIRKLANKTPKTKDIYSVIRNGDLHKNPKTQDVYSVTINGEKIKTVVTKDGAAVDEWIDKVYKDYKDEIEESSKKEDCKKRFVVGLHVEWKPVLRDYTDPVATLQLCVGHRCLIYQISLRSYRVPWSLLEFLEDESIRFVGVGIEDVAVKLEMGFDICVERAVDLGELAAEWYGKEEFKDLGLMELATRVMRWGGISSRWGGIEKPTDAAESNWGQKYLTQEQIMSACVDAYVSFKIGNQFRRTYYRTSILD